MGANSLALVRSLSMQYIPVAFAVLVGSLLVAAAARAQSDADIFAQIEVFRPAAELIVVDGNAGDWSALPLFSDAVDDVPGDPSREIVAASIAPLEQELLVLAELGGAPLAGSVYSLLFDFTLGPRQEIQIALNSTTGVHGLVIFDDLGNPVSSTTITGLGLALGASHIEVRIPYSVLTPALPLALADALDPANHRSWVRAQVLSMSAPTVIADFGPSVGAYRWIATPYPLDPPLPSSLPNSAGPPIQIELPLAGEWLLGQGPDGTFSHGGTWAYDWVKVNEEFFPSDPFESATNADYFAFGEPLFAPATGTVSVAIDSNPDQPPGVTGPVNNEVRVDIGGGFAVRLLHEMQGSVLVSVGQPVDPSMQVAQVGNSGFSNQAHLHLDVLNAGSHRVAHPNVIIGLNPVPGDPWRRALALWEPRVGFLAQNAPLQVPSLGLVGMVSTTLLMVVVVARMMRTRPLRSR